MNTLFTAMLKATALLVTVRVMQMGKEVDSDGQEGKLRKGIIHDYEQSTRLLFQGKTNPSRPFTECMERVAFRMRMEMKNGNFAR